MFNLFDVKIPSPDEILIGPEYMRYKKKEFNKACKEIIRKLKREFLGTSYVSIYLDAPKVVREDILDAFRSKGWKVVLDPNHSKHNWSYEYYLFGYPTFEDPVKSPEGW